MDDRLRKVESDIAVLKRDCEDVKKDMSDMRRLEAEVNSFMTTFNATQKAMDKAQQERHEENSYKLDKQNSKMNFIGVCVAIATAVILIATAYIAYRASVQHAFNFVGNNSVVAYEYHPQ